MLLLARAAVGSAVDAARPRCRRRAAAHPPTSCRMSLLVISKESMHSKFCRIEVVTWKPRALVLHGFLTDEECDHIVKARGGGGR